MKINVVDNGGQWTHREWRVLRSLGVQCEIVPNTVDSSSLDDLDGLVLSGGAPSIVDELDKLGNISTIISDHDYPILGICAGAHFIALHFGGRVEPGTVPEYGKTEVYFHNNDSIFSGMGKNITAWENHNDEIKELPPEFVVSAYSRNCAVQAFYHVSKPIFGVQFHPEVENTARGRELFQNFIRECELASSTVRGTQKKDF